MIGEEMQGRRIDATADSDKRDASYTFYQRYLVIFATLR